MESGNELWGGLNQWGTVTTINESSGLAIFGSIAILVEQDIAVLSIMRSLQATPPFVKGGRGDLKLGEVRPTPSRGRGKISPHPSLSKRGVQATWEIRIGEVHPRSYPAASSFSTTFATDPLLGTFPHLGRSRTSGLNLTRGFPIAWVVVMMTMQCFAMPGIEDYEQEEITPCPILIK